jgi:hypothetical protein
MKEIKGDIWIEAKKVDGLVVVPTNGFVKKNGECVMGRGLAQQIKEKYPDFPKTLGSFIQTLGNHVYAFIEPYHVITFPVKHNWWERADLKLIEQSCDEIGLLERKDFPTIFLPHVGCGNGGLSWIDVKPLVVKYLEEFSNIVICDYHE